MHTISRREFCGKAAASIAAASFLSGSERRLLANPLGLPIGSQVYPHRQRIQDGDFAGLCKDMAAIGVTSLELDSPDYPYARDPQQRQRSQESSGRPRTQVSEHPHHAECATEPDNRR